MNQQFSVRQGKIHGIKIRCICYIEKKQRGTAEKTPSALALHLRIRVPYFESRLPRGASAYGLQALYVLMPGLVPVKQFSAARFVFSLYLKPLCTACARRRSPYAENEAAGFFYLENRFIGFTVGTARL